MSDFVNFGLAKKLKEKEFTIPTKSIFGMYNEIGVFHTLTSNLTSKQHSQVSNMF